MAHALVSAPKSSPPAQHSRGTPHVRASCAQSADPTLHGHPCAQTPTVEMLHCVDVQGEHMGVSPAAIEAVEDTTDSPPAGAVDGGDAISGAGADSGYGGGVTPPPPLPGPSS